MDAATSRSGVVTLVCGPSVKTFEVELPSAGTSLREATSHVGLAD